MAETVLMVYLVGLTLFFVFGSIPEGVEFGQLVGMAFGWPVVAGAYIVRVTIRECFRALRG